MINYVFLNVLFYLLYVFIYIFIIIFFKVKVVYFFNFKFFFFDKEMNKLKKIKNIFRINVNVVRVKCKFVIFNWEYF